jgi:hypothetical protein
MARCPTCDYPLPNDRERLGARCPNCRDPLYEPAGRFARPARPDEAACVAHPESEAVSACLRCGATVCETCRCPWRGQVLCVSCVERAYANGEGESGQGRLLTRQSVAALLLGSSAWLLSGLFYYTVRHADPQAGLGILILQPVLGLGAGLVALFGVGLGASALRNRGQHVPLATVGLALSGLLLGTLLGLVTFTLWQV